MGCEWFCFTALTNRWPRNPPPRVQPSCQRRPYKPKHRCHSDSLTSCKSEIQRWPKKTLWLCIRYIVYIGMSSCQGYASLPLKSLICVHVGWLATRILTLTPPNLSLQRAFCDNPYLKNTSSDVMCIHVQWHSFWLRNISWLAYRLCIALRLMIESFSMN